MNNLMEKTVAELITEQLGLECAKRLMLMPLRKARKVLAEITKYCSERTINKLAGQISRARMEVELYDIV